MNHSINNNNLLRAVGVELDAQVSTAYTSGEEKQRIEHRTFRHGLGSRRVQNVHLPGNDVHGRHSVSKSIGE